MTFRLSFFIFLIFDLYLGQNFENCWNVLEILKSLDIFKHFWLSWPFGIIWFFYLHLGQNFENRYLLEIRNVLDIWLSWHFDILLFYFYFLTYIWVKNFFFYFHDLLAFLKIKYLHLCQNFENCWNLLEILRILDIFKHFWLSWPFDLLSIFFLPFDLHLGQNFELKCTRNSVNFGYIRSYLTFVTFWHYFIFFTYIWVKILKIVEIYLKFWNCLIYLSIFDFLNLSSFF